MTHALKIAVIGLGEAGDLLADGLQKAGANVIGYDSAKIKRPPMPMAASIREAVADADVVLSVNSATTSLRVAEEAAKTLGSEAIFADLNTGTPGLKLQLSKIFPDGQFVDVAVMKPVPRFAEKVPMGVSGAGAKKFIELLKPLGMDLEYVSEKPGDAAARKLLWSIVGKGMAGLIIDYLWAAERMGLQDWAFEEVKRAFDASSSATVQGYLDGTAKHAKRRTMEMNDVSEMLAEIGYESTTVHATFATLSQVMHSKRVPFANLKDD